MTESGCVQGVRGNLQVPPKERAGAKHRRRRAEGSRGKLGFPRASEPKARDAA